MQCKYCEYVWEPRVPEPKVCPQCKRYLKKEYKKRGRPKVKKEVIHVGS